MAERIPMQREARLWCLSLTAHAADEAKAASDHGHPHLPHPARSFAEGFGVEGEQGDCLWFILPQAFPAHA